MNIVTYKGFAARVEFDAEDEILIGRLAGINDLVSFHADGVEELHAAFREAVDDYVETCRKIGKTPEKAFSGNLMLRVSPEIHAKAALAAELSGKSMNQWAEDALRSITKKIPSKRPIPPRLAGEIASGKVSPGRRRRRA